MASDFDQENIKSGLDDIDKEMNAVEDLMPRNDGDMYDE